MNTDDVLQRALKGLREPLPPEQSLVSSVLERLDQSGTVKLAQAKPCSGPVRRRLGRLAQIGIAAGALLAISLFGLFKQSKPLTFAEVNAAVERERWVHLVYQDGSERWVCLDDGKLIMKWVRDSDRAEYFMRDPATRSEQRFDGLNPIRQFSPPAWVLGRNRNGKIIPVEVDELTFSDEELSDPRHTPDEERGKLPAIRDYELVVENGHKLGHFSDYRRDALGELQLRQELWVDLNTKLPTRIRTWDFDGNTARRVPHEGTYHFVKTGPNDLYDLGVSRDIPIVPEVNTIEDAKRLIPAETWKAIDGAKAAVLHFPHRFRVLTLEDEGRQTVTYVDSGDAHPFGWFDEIAHQTVGRYFIADCQNSSEASPEFADLVTKASRDLISPFPADALARSFPLSTAPNTTLIDGRRWFNLNRSNFGSQASRLQVLTASGSHGVSELYSQWEYAHWNWRELATGKSTDTAPGGQILIHAERHDWKNDWFVDPERDYTVARHLEYRLNQGKWDRREARAVTWERLPDGPWYVSAWETRYKAMTTQADAEGKETQVEKELIDVKHVVITPLAPHEFPADIFDGDQFLKAAKEAGAEVRVQ